MSDRSLMLNDPAAYYANVGAQAERKRIVELLTTQWETLLSAHLFDTANVYKSAIDLIGRETK